MRCFSSYSIAILWTAAAGVPFARADEPWFIWLGDLPGGYLRSEAKSASCDGWFIAGNGTTRYGWDTDQPFLWDPENGMRGLGYFPGQSYAETTRMSDDGTAVVGGGNKAPHAFEAFRWTEATGIVGLGDLPGGAHGSKARACSSDGAVVVGNSNSARSGQDAEPFVWTESDGMRDLGPDGPLHDYAQDVSADGRVIVGGTGEAWRWTAEDGFEVIPPFPGETSIVAMTISGDGRSIFGWASTKIDGQRVLPWYRWTRETGTKVLDHRFCDCWPWDASHNGAVVVGEGTDPIRAGDAAIFWTPKLGNRVLEHYIPRRLGIDLQGFYLVRAWGVSCDGRTIVGSGYFSGSKSEAWAVYLGRPERAADLNCDGSLNAGDIEGFALALRGVEAYELEYPICNRDNADCNADGSINGLDVEPFLRLIMP